MIMTSLILLFFGTICDMGPVIILATPVLLSIAKSVGTDPVHFGIILLIIINVFPRSGTASSKSAKGQILAL